MNREYMHQEILALKGRICSGDIQINPYEDHLISHLDQVKLSEDGLIDESTISSTLQILMSAVKED